jgi:hypothetical protein
MSRTFLTFYIRECISASYFNKKENVNRAAFYSKSAEDILCSQLLNEVGIIMSSINLPAYLQQILENHVQQSDLVMDEELDGIFNRLSELSENVEKAKRQILENRRRNI